MSTNNSWRNMAVPRQDEVDTSNILSHLPGNPIPRAKSIQPRESTIFNDQTAIRYSVLSEEQSYKFDNAPFDHPNIAAAENLLKKVWPVVHNQFQKIIREFQPVYLTGNQESGQFGSMSHQPSNRYGSIWATVNDTICLAQAFVHEMAHNKLYAIGQAMEASFPLFLNNENEEYDSPVRIDIPRPISAIFHGLYAFTHVVALDRRLLESNVLSDEERRYTVTLLSKNVRKIKIALETIKKCAVPTKEGMDFISDTIEWAKKEINLTAQYHRADLDDISAIFIIGPPSGGKGNLSKKLSRVLNKQLISLDNFCWDYWYGHSIVQRCMVQIFGDSRTYLLNRSLKSQDKMKLVKQLLEKTIIHSGIFEQLKLDLFSYVINRFPEAIINIGAVQPNFNLIETTNKLKAYFIQKKVIAIQSSPLNHLAGKLESFLNGKEGTANNRDAFRDMLRSPGSRILTDYIFDSDDSNLDLSVFLSGIFSCSDFSVSKAT